MEYKQTKTNDILIIKPTSTRLGFSQDLKNLLDKSISQGHKKIIFNCSKVQFFDTGFLGIVVGAKKNGGKDCRIGFCRVDEALFSIFTLTGTDKIFHFFDTQKEGLAYFQA